MKKIVTKRIVKWAGCVISSKIMPMKKNAKEAMEKKKLINLKKLEVYVSKSNKETEKLRFFLSKKMNSKTTLLWLYKKCG